MGLLIHGPRSFTLPMTVQLWWELLIAFGYGLLGSLVPVINGEAYVAATIVAKLATPIPMGCALGLGQGLGKLGLLLAIRNGRRLPGPWQRRLRNASSTPDEPGPWRRRWRKLVTAGVGLVEHPRWGAVGMLNSGMLSIPPNYPTTILVATTRVRAPVFAFWLTVGYMIRFVIIGWAATGIFERFGISLP